MSQFIIRDTQKQAIDSELVVLYDLEYATGSFARFCASLEEDLTTVKFRDTSGAEQEYTAIPLDAEGFDNSADGSYSRPQITEGNVVSITSFLATGMVEEDLIGRRLTRRVTLKKYLVGEPSDSGSGVAPVEFPSSVYIIDRIVEKNILSITFELSSPFDLQGIALPRRVIIGGSCPWRYKQARTSLGPQDRVGGCNWDNKFTDGSGNLLFMNAFDEYIVPNTISFPTFSSNANANNYRKTVASLTRKNADGTTTTVSTFHYWQALKTTSVTPSNSSVDWRRVRVYDPYDNAVTYEGYTDKKHNHYILESNRLWQVANKTLAPTHPAREEGINWTEGDLCGKKITSCKLRFQAKDSSGGVSIVTDSNKSLPFGGFPGVQRRR